MPLKIAIDLHSYDGKYQGSRTHVLEIFSRVVNFNPKIQFLVFVDNVEGLRREWPAFSVENCQIVRMTSKGAIRRLFFQMPALCRRYKVNFIHTQYILPIWSRAKGFVTIHDVLFETHPKFFSLSFRVRSSVAMRLSAWFSLHIFTVSDFSFKALEHRFGVKKEKISVIYNGADHSRFFPGQAGVEAVESRGLGSARYVLSVGRLEPRKNHVVLIKAFELVADFYDRLVIVGQKDFGFSAALEAIELSPFRDRISVIEDVTDVELPALFRHASAFCFPAFAEGFGMPPLEAMASGVPVVVSRGSALEEVVGDAGMVCDPEDVEGFARCLRELAVNKDAHARHAQEGLERSRNFSWDASARTVSAVYKKFAA